MLQSYLVVDNFYPEPMKVREHALTLDYLPKQAHHYHAGKNSRQKLLTPESDQTFSQILREPVVGRWEDTAHGHCRLALADDEVSGGVHIDSRTTWAGIIYLTLDEHCKGGTEFFRHKRTGRDRAPLTDQEARDLFGMESRDDIMPEIIQKDGAHMDRWEHIMTLPMAFNRCVFFRPWFWHKTGINFGDRKENGRLVQLLFFRSPQAGAMST